MRNRFESFCGSVIELGRYIQKIKDIEMRRFGLRANHTMCLYCLGCNADGLTATQLSDLCKEDKSAVSRCLAQLIDKGFVYCVLPENKRSYRTLHYLTEKGKALVEKMNNRVEMALFNGSNGLSDIQRDSLYSSMDIIIKNLSQYLEDSKNN